MRTGDKVAGAQAAAAVIEIRKEKNRGIAFLAGSDDIPFPIPGLDKHGTLLSVVNGNVGQMETRTVTIKSGEQ